jgi:hypothetical protein
MHFQHKYTIAVSKQALITWCMILLTLLNKRSIRRGIDTTIELNKRSTRRGIDTVVELNKRSTRLILFSTLQSQKYQSEQVCSVPDIHLTFMPYSHKWYIHVYIVILFMIFLNYQAILAVNESRQTKLYISVTNEREVWRFQRDNQNKEIRFKMILMFIWIYFKKYTFCLIWSDPTLYMIAEV